MTSKQIAETLKDKGFETETIGGIVVVSLANRPVCMMEIEAALDYQISREHMARTSDGATAIIGQA